MNFMQRIGNDYIMAKSLDFIDNIKNPKHQAGLLDLCIFGVEKFGLYIINIEQ